MNHDLIILFENDLYLRQSIALILQRVGYLVTPTDCVEHAIDLIKSRHYHLIISDDNIPEVRTLLLPQIQALRPSISTIILTDRPTPEINELDHPANIHYLEKLVAPEQLLDCIASVLVIENDGFRIKKSHQKRGHNLAVR